MKSYIAAALLAAATAGCLGGGPTGLADADTRILFVGNSLTGWNDLPALVNELATAMDLSMSHASIVAPNYALDDHWYRGLEEQIRRMEPDLVVMQQGPSSLPASREHLVYWTGVIDPVVRAVGGRSALFMVWPDYTRTTYFDDVRDSYRAAAQAVDGVFAPAGWSWVEAWERDPELRLYAQDGFHPSYLGSLVAAHTLLAVILDVDPSAIPALDDGVDAETLAVIREAVAASIAAWGT